MARGGGEPGHTNSGPAVCQPLYCWSTIVLGANLYCQRMPEVPRVLVCGGPLQCHFDVVPVVRAVVVVCVHLCVGTWSAVAAVCMEQHVLRLHGVTALAP